MTRLCLLAALVLAAAAATNCDSESDEAAIEGDARAYIQALAEWDTARVVQLTCDTHRDEIEDALSRRSPLGASTGRNTEPGLRDVRFGRLDRDALIDELTIEGRVYYGSTTGSIDLSKHVIEVRQTRNGWCIGLSRIHEALSEARPPSSVRFEPDTGNDDNGAMIWIDAPHGQSLEAESTFEATIRISRAVDVGAYEFVLNYDPAIIEVESIVNGEFLGSSGREVFCPDPRIEPGTAGYFCSTLGAEPRAGASGAGELARIEFSARALGTSTISLARVGIVDPPGETEFNVTALGGEFVVE